MLVSVETRLWRGRIQARAQSHKSVSHELWAWHAAWGKNKMLRRVTFRFDL